MAGFAGEGVGGVFEGLMEVEEGCVFWGLGWGEGDFGM